MTVARHLEDLPIATRAVATGTFDGLHPGHRAVRSREVAEQLTSCHAVSMEVVDLRLLEAETTAASVQKTSRAVCVEEGWPSYGVTAEFAARIQRACFDDLNAPVERVEGAEVPFPYAKKLESAGLSSQDRIAAAVPATLGLGP